MKTADYDFNLPRELIALRPADKRDGSRLLVLHRNGRIEHRNFYDLPSYMNKGDMLLLNDTRVFPARITGFKPTGGKVEILLEKELSPGIWTIMMKGNYRGPLSICPDLSADVAEGVARFDRREDLKEILREQGAMPLPPYIKRPPDADDRERYQTVYAEEEGSIAAPTAGLHFTRELLKFLESSAVLVRSLTLHVGAGTFRLVKSDDPREHVMQTEPFEIPQGLIAEINAVRAGGNRVVAVGTTTTRAIEGYLSGKCDVFSANGTIKGATNIFIHGGYKPRAVDALITNFHLPRSTPLMLTSVFSGRENLLKTYEKAISMKYRFFSYGDAMLVL